MRKIPFAGIELTSQRVRGLRGTSELPGRPYIYNPVCSEIAAFGFTTGRGCVAHKHRVIRVFFPLPARKPHGTIVGLLSVCFVPFLPLYLSHRQQQQPHYTHTAAASPPKERITTTGNIFFFCFDPVPAS